MRGEGALNHSTVLGMNRSRGCMYSAGACRATTSASLSFAAMPLSKAPEAQEARDTPGLQARRTQAGRTQWHGTYDSVVCEVEQSLASSPATVSVAVCVRHQQQDCQASTAWTALGLL